MLKKPLVTVLGLCMMLVLNTQTVAAGQGSAATVRLAKTEGTVAVTDSSGISSKVSANMRLFSGHHVKTQAKSYAWLNLDDSKAAKLDAVSELEVRKDGSNLEVLVASGNIFFNVSKPLNDNENLNIRTSTMVTGIRGTCGTIKAIDPNHTQIDLYTGNLQCVVTNPVTGENQSVDLHPGDSALFNNNPTASGGTGTASMVQTGRISSDNIDGFALTEIVANDDLKNQISNASGIDLSGVSAADAAARLATDQAETQQSVSQVQQQAQQQSAQSSQAGSSNVNSVWSSSDDSSSSSSSSGSSSSASSLPLINQTAPSSNSNSSRANQSNSSNETSVETYTVSMESNISTSEVSCYLFVNNISGNGSKTVTASAGDTIYAGVIYDQNEFDLKSIEVYDSAHNKVKVGDYKNLHSTSMTYTSFKMPASGVRVVAYLSEIKDHYTVTVKKSGLASDDNGVSVFVNDTNKEYDGPFSSNIGDQIKIGFCYNSHYVLRCNPTGTNDWTYVGSDSSGGTHWYTFTVNNSDVTIEAVFEKQN